MLIYYCIAPNNKGLLLEYGMSPESQMLREFAEHDDVPSYEVLQVDVAEGEEFFAEDAEMHVQNHLDSRAA